MQCDQYVYQNLSEPTNIRLLQILPDSEESLLRVGLVETSLAHSGPYVALSYVWGGDKPSRDVYIDNCILKARQNLFGALRKLRKLSIRTVWVDAICIDQDNLQERAEQVTLMRKIYQQAYEVIYYLGEVDSIESQGLATLLNSLFLVFVRQEHGMVPVNGKVDWSNLRRYGLPDISDPIWKYFVKFLENPWFSRVWVIQESLVATGGRFVRGDQWIDQQALYALLYVLANYPSLASHIDRTFRLCISPVHRAILRCSLVFHLQGGKIVLRPTVTGSIGEAWGRGTAGATWFPSPLIYLLKISNSMTASDPRDHIFALLGVSYEAEEISLRPTYSESREHIYLQVANYLVKEGYGPQLLYHATPVGSNTNLPSWVPQWDNKSLTQPLNPKLHGLHLSDHFQATRQSKPVFRVSESNDRLTVRGIIFDVVKLVGSRDCVPTSTESMTPNDCFTVPMACLAEVISMIEGAEQYLIGETRSEVLCRLLLCDQLNTGTRLPKEFSLRMVAWVIRESMTCPGTMKSHLKNTLRVATYIAGDFPGMSVDRIT
jgi:hypothetical protein